MGKSTINGIEWYWSIISSPISQSYYSAWWLSHPSEKHESQLGWWHSQYTIKYEIHVQTTNQMIFGDGSKPCTPGEPQKFKLSHDLIPKGLPLSPRGSVKRTAQTHRSTRRGLGRLHRWRCRWARHRWHRWHRWHRLIAWKGQPDRKPMKNP